MSRSHQVIFPKPSAVPAAALRVVLVLALTLAPVSRSVLAVPATAGSVPLQEENEEEEKSDADEDAKEFAPARPDGRPHPPAGRFCPATGPPPVRPSAVALPRAADLDHFRNGLGCPFRC